MTMIEKPRKSVRRRYGKWLIFLCILLIGSAAVVVWTLRTRMPLLLEIATQVVPKERYYGELFAWMSNEEYVCFGKDGRTLCRYRLSTGVSTPLLKQFDAPWYGCDVQLSPNGKWLYWAKVKGPPRPVGTGTYSYNGPVYFQCYITRLADAHTQALDGFDDWQWEPDSRHMININPMSEGANETTLVIRDALTNRIHQKVPFAPNLSASRGNTRMVAPGRLLGIAPISSGLRASDEHAPVEITEYGLDTSLHIVRKWSVVLPHHPAVQGAIISPTGDRIAWLVTADYVDPGLAALHHLLPFLKVPSQPRQELWISRLDGTEMRAVGQTQTKMTHGYALQIYDIRWLPDERHLSFVYDQALWTVPANR